MIYSESDLRTETELNKKETYDAKSLGTSVAGTVYCSHMVIGSRWLRQEESHLSPGKPSLQAVNCPCFSDGQTVVSRGGRSSSDFTAILHFANDRKAVINPRVSRAVDALTLGMVAVSWSLHPTSRQSQSDFEEFTRVTSPDVPDAVALVPTHRPPSAEGFRLLKARHNRHVV
ncbi:unnamed protein product [Arctia plantaginis]|uniref:Uncharacterized protein n=1 Tax=Arctia plantaginis TaxID=874455 RepID=A0A8S0ZHW1_ARCPL|nr:unnamed protein product [Arctia plantaginis]